MHPYKEIFEGIYSTLKGITKLSGEKFDKELEKYMELETRNFSDEEYFSQLITIPFYSGFRASTIESKIERIEYYFSDYRKILNYGENEIKEMMQDEKMIKNRSKIEGCIKNACTFSKIIEKYGSFQDYVNSFEIKDSFENLMLFKEEIELIFRYLGATTSYHFMMEIGLQVLKPDRVITRMFKNFGLIENENQLLKKVIQGRNMSEAVNYPIRVIDIIFIKYGQMGKDEEFKLDDGICLLKNPKCYICGVKEFCHLNDNV
jgi:DNA-3-methyladenine glycosylase I